MTVTETELYPIPAGVTLPPKFTGLRAHQAKAIDEIMEAFETVDVVYLDAPVGCLDGDTVIQINRAGKGSKIKLDYSLVS